MKNSFFFPCVAAVLLLSLALSSCNKEKGQDDMVHSFQIPESVQLELDEEYQLTATIPSSDRQVVNWSSSNPDIVTVDEDSGMLKAVFDEGEATITATLFDFSTAQRIASATCLVNVETNYSLSLDYTSVKLAQNGSVTVTALPAPSTGFGKISWSSSNGTIVNVSSATGVTTKFNGQSTNGKAKVTAKLFSRFDSTTPKATATCEVEVESFYVEKLNLPAELNLVKGETFKLNPKIEPEQASDIPLTYTVTTGSNYVSVDNKGVVTAKEVSNGSSAAIVVKSTDDKAYSETVRIYVDPVPVYPTSASLTGFADETYVGKGFNATINYTKSGTGTPNQHGTTTVTSSNPSVASVTKTASGFSVDPLSTGTTTITVVYHTSVTKTMSLAVKLAVFSGPTTLYWSSDQRSALQRGMVVGETLTVRAQMINTNHATVNYSSSNTNVATVDANGKITAKGKGTAYITAQSAQYPTITQQTVFFTVYGVPATITCVSGNTNPIFLRYGNVTTKTMEFQVKDANGDLSRQDLTVAITGLVNIYPSTALKSGGAELTLNNHRTSATSTIKGSMAVSPLGYPSVKLTYDVYDTMYDKNDPKPFDGIGILNDKGQFAFRDGGYRGSGYFEDVSSSSFKDCIAIIFWVGEHPQTGISMLKNLHGHSFSSRPLIHGLAVATQNARKSADEDLVKWWTVSQKQGDAVNLSSQYTGFWNSGNPGYGYTSVSTTNTGLYGYEITRGMKFYNEKVKSNAKYTVIPVKNIVDYMPETHPENNYNSGWYLPTSGEWYRMLHCLEGATVEQTRDKINEYIKKTSGWTTIGGSIEYWSCQEAADAPDGSAVYMTGNSATEAGKKPTRYKEKQETCKVRPFIAF